eukprot:gene11116-19992_t
MADGEEGGRLPKIVKSCFMHFEDIKENETGLEQINSDNFDLEWYCHKTCYKRLCDEEKIRRAEANKNLINTSSSSKETDDNNSLTTNHDNDNQHDTTIPQVNTAGGWSGKRKRVPLTLCQTEDAGQLCHAAELKNNEKILLQIRDQDCVAIQFQIISFERLQKMYPQLVFFTPRMSNKSEKVYVENLSYEDILDEHMKLKETILEESIAMDDEYVLPGSSQMHVNELQEKKSGQTQSEY